MKLLLILVPLVTWAAGDQGQLLLSAIHAGDTAAVRVALNAGADANTRGDRGTTALMQAAAYAPIDSLKALIDAGADVNARSDDGFTALLWAASDPAKLKLLLKHKADVKARSKDGNTALILARQNGWTASVPVLLAAGAPDEDGMDNTSRPILSMSHDLLLQLRSVGAEPMHSNGPGDAMSNVVSLYDGPVPPLRRMLDTGADPNTMTTIRTLQLPAISMAAAMGNLGQVRELLSRGADPNLPGSRKLTPLMAATVVEFQDPALLKALLAKGARVNDQDETGRTALDWALLQGETDVVRILRAAGGHSMAPPQAPPQAVSEPRSARDAIGKAVALLQPTAPRFFRQSGGCVSCHNVVLPGMAAHHALDQRFAADPELMAYTAKVTLATWRPVEEKLAVGASALPGLLANVSYGLAGLAEMNYPRNAVTEAAALAILRLQRSDGSWLISDIRPPLGGNPILWTALSIHGLQAYAPGGLRKQTDRVIQHASAYLATVHTRTALDDCTALLGLVWAGANPETIAKVRDRVLAEQRQDGGWSPLPTLPSDAYATGKALYSLKAAGMQGSDAVYGRGVQYLLHTQLPDGSWFVQSRALSFQPYQETGFPHGKSQFISSAATSWAVIALAHAGSNVRLAAR